MSCIIAVRHNDGFYIAADSKVTQGSYSVNEMDYKNKIFSKNGIVFAVIGNTSFAQRIKYELSVPMDIDKEPFNEEFVYKHIVSQLRDFAEQDNFNVYVAYKNKCFAIENSLCVMEVDEFYSEGTGCSLAEGALEVLIHIDKCNQIDAIRHAYRIVINRMTTVGYPICIYDTRTGKQHTIIQKNKK